MDVDDRFCQPQQENVVDFNKLVSHKVGRGSAVMKTIAQKISILALAVTAALATSGCSFDYFRSPSSDYAQPGDLSQDVESLPDPSEFKRTNSDRVVINNVDAMRRTESPERLLMQAGEYFDQKRYHDSARLYKKYLATPAAGAASPDILATAHYRIGFVADKKTQYQEAILEYRQALQIAPFNNDYLFAYARACYEANDFATAETQFAQLESRAPGYPEARYYYGLTLLESANRSRALQPLIETKGELEAYRLLADKHYAKGELQFAVQAESQMNQIAAKFGLNAPELPHKAKAAQAFATSTPALGSTLANVPPLNVDQGNAATPPSVQTSVVETQSSTVSSPLATSNVQRSAPIDSSNETQISSNTQQGIDSQRIESAQAAPLVANANPAQVQTELQETFSQVARSVQETPPNVVKTVPTPQNAPSRSFVPPVAPPSVQQQAEVFANSQPVPAAQAQANVQNAQDAQIQNAPNTTVNIPLNPAQNQFAANVQNAQDAQIQNAANTPADVPQNLAPLATTTSGTYAESFENEEDDDSWEEDEFAFACSGQPSEPIPTASLIASEGTRATPPLEGFLAEEAVGEYQESETYEDVDSLTSDSLRSIPSETFAQLESVLDEKPENLSIQEDASELAQTVVPAPPESPNALEIATTLPDSEEGEINADSLAVYDLYNADDYNADDAEFESSESNESFIDFRPGSTMNASLVTIPEREIAVENAASVEKDAEFSNKTFISDYNVPQFPQTRPYAQDAENVELYEPVRRVYSVKDLERLVNDWALFELNLITYLTTTNKEEAIVQKQDVAPPLIARSVSPTVPPQGYNSPEEFFRSTPPMGEPLIQHTPQTNDGFVRQTPTTNVPLVPNSLENEGRLDERTSEISHLKLNPKRNSTPEERLQAARAAGAEVVELTPEQYRQAITFGTSRR